MQHQKLLVGPWWMLESIAVQVVAVELLHWHGKLGGTLERLCCKECFLFVMSFGVSSEFHDST